MATRETALRLPFLVAAGGYLLIYLLALPRLGKGTIEAAREAGIAPT